MTVDSRQIDRKAGKKLNMSTDEFPDTIMENESAQLQSVNVFIFFLSTTLSYFSVHSSYIEKLILRWLNKQTTRERELLLEKFTLKSEQQKISMIDSFAKYSKIQRKINAIDEELGTIKGKKPSSSIFVQLGFSYGVKLAIGVLLTILSIYYWQTPVFTLHKDINLVPFTNLVSFPNEANSVSFHFWVMCCTAIARLI